MEQVDLLVFGPHPDDLEIGAGGTVAKHAAMGLRVGLCDLTAGEMSSNGTVEERLAEAEDARTVLTEAIFNAGLRRFRAQGEPWKPEMTSYYFINESTQPSFVVDVTAHYE